MQRFVLALIMTFSLLYSPCWLLASRGALQAGAQTIESSPSKSVMLFFGAVAERNYESAHKFLPRSIIKMLENEFPGGLRAFIDTIAKENEGNMLVIQSEKIEEGKAQVETVTITRAGKRITEKWQLRLEDNFWKLDILLPR